MAELPEALAPSPGARGFATDDRVGLAERVGAAWALLAAYAETCDLRALARARGRTGLDVLLPVGRWPDSRGIGNVLADARAERAHRIDQHSYDDSLRVRHRDAGPEDAVEAVRRAGAEATAWFGSSEDDSDGLLLTASPLGALPVRTLLHATVYQLAVTALDLEPCSDERVPAELLGLGLVALVDSSGCLAARHGLHASLVADARAATTEDASAGVWGFGASGGDWQVLALPEPVGPSVTAPARVVLDITAGRTAHVPGLVRSGELRLHDVPGLLHLAPLVDEVPGIPGASALRVATASLGLATTVLGGLRRRLGGS